MAFSISKAYFATIISIVLSSHAFACKCAEVSDEDRMKYASRIVIVEVISVSLVDGGKTNASRILLDEHIAEGFNSVQVKFKELEVIKGIGPDSFDERLTSCYVRFFPKEKYIVFIDEYNETSFCYGTQRIEDFGEERLKALKDAREDKR